MKKKILSILSVFLLMVLIGLIFIGCGKKSGGKKAGGEDATDLIELYDKDEIAEFVRNRFYDENGNVNTSYWETPATSYFYSCEVPEEITNFEISYLKDALSGKDSYFLVEFEQRGHIVGNRTKRKNSTNGFPSYRFCPFESIYKILEVPFEDRYATASYTAYAMVDDITYVKKNYAMSYDEMWENEKKITGRVCMEIENLYYGIVYDMPYGYFLYPGRAIKEVEEDGVTRREEYTVYCELIRTVDYENTAYCEVLAGHPLMGNYREIYIKKIKERKKKVRSDYDVDFTTGKDWV